MKNKRFLGQHFLISQNIKDKIFETAEKYAPLCKSILEIGPGTGAITQILLRLNKPFFAVEKDNILSHNLKEKFRNLVLFEEDARSFSFESIEKKFYPMMIIGNLPYYAATDIMLNLLAYPSRISSAHFTIQKEVALKFSSSTGQKYYSKYSVWTHCYYDTKIDFSIGKGCFSPPPKVTSSFLTFIPKDYFELDESDSLKFFSFLEKLFQQQRKKIAPLIEQITAVDSEKFLNNKNARAKDIPEEKFVLIFKNLR